jgi:hypothetical protein
MTLVFFAFRTRCAATLTTPSAAAFAAAHNERLVRVYYGNDSLPDIRGKTRCVTRICVLAKVNVY